MLSKTNQADGFFGGGETYAIVTTVSDVHVRASVPIMRQRSAALCASVSDPDLLGIRHPRVRRQSRAIETPMLLSSFPHSCKCLWKDTQVRLARHVPEKRDGSSLARMVTPVLFLAIAAPTLARAQTDVDPSFDPEKVAAIRAKAAAAGVRKVYILVGDSGSPAFAKADKVILWNIAAERAYGSIAAVWPAYNAVVIEPGVNDADPFGEVLRPAGIKEGFVQSNLYEIWHPRFVNPGRGEGDQRELVYEVFIGDVVGRATVQKTRTAGLTPSTSVGRPKIRTGDSYIIESIYMDNPELSNTTERKVTFVGDGKMTVTSKNIKSKTGKGRTLQFTSDWNLISSRNLDESGFDYAPPLKYFDFPLYPGKTWQQTSSETNIKTGAVREHTLSATVGDWEEVSVPAGTFRAIRITIQTKLLDPATAQESSGTDISWYSPIIRRSVKSAIISQDFLGNKKRQLIQVIKVDLK